MDQHELEKPDYLRDGAMIVKNIAGLMIQIPLLGPIASCIYDFLPHARLERIRQFLTDVDGRVKRIEDQASFGFLLERAVRVAASDHRDFKRAILAAVLEDAAGTGPERVSENRLFIDLTEALEPYHIAILRTLMDAETEFPANLDTGSPFIPFDELAKAVANPSYTLHELAINCISTLSQHALILSRPSNPRMISSLTGPTDMIKHASYSLSGLGDRFCSFLRKGSASK